jgi:(1->4)-alpha-D-glucan 1-alpha-D-glucosylmutase
VSRELRASYRLQLGRELTLERVLDYVPYLRDLGVSHLYLSPVLQARAGSTHGYDGVDPSQISHALGGARAFRALCDRAHAAGLGVLLDVVPNHLAASEEENVLWREQALRERFFDLDPATGRHRRFFDDDELAGVRVEEPEIFEATHALVLDLVREGLVDGLRVDHPDGLADPAGYLERLSVAGVEQIWVEKILGPGEQLREWPVEGTTGYDFLNDAQALFVDPAGETILTELAGETRTWAEVAFQAKLEQAEITFAPEVERLRRLLDLPGLPHALASLPVYRTYVEPSTGRVEDADTNAIAGLPDEFRRVLLLEQRGHDEFVTRFQQTTGPVMAKGVEDTAFYRYVRLLALNEVGGDPSRFSLEVDEFHAANARRSARCPHGLLAGTTHDTKRSADVRARIGALAGMAARWRESVLRWHELTAGIRPGPAPDWTEELFVYQTLVGAWPIGLERLGPYLQKSLREAKRNTSWTDPNEEWESDVARFASELCVNDAFLAEFEPFAADVAAAGSRAALGQLVLRFTSPGIPDLYGGDELPLLALVDPDNRRGVNLERRRITLSNLSSTTANAAPKLWTIRQLLDLRARKPNTFAGAYEPLPAGAETCAFKRGGDLLVAVSLGSRPPELAPPSNRWRNVLSALQDSPAVVFEKR